MINFSYIIPDMFNLKEKEESMKTENAIFYIKYYAKKHDSIIERKATLDDNDCGLHTHKKYGYPYYRYVDLDMTEELGHDKDGKPQYRQASKKWEINNQPTLTE